MIFSTIFRLLIVLIGFGSVFVQGCVKHTGANNQTPDVNMKYLRTTLKSCITTVTTNPDLDSSVDFYVLHSRWFIQTETETCKLTQATAACWQKELNNIIHEYKTLSSTIKTCIGSYATAATTVVGDDGGEDGGDGGPGLIAKKRVLRSTNDALERATRSTNPNAVRCPAFSVADFKSKVDELTVDLEDTTDQTISGIDKLAEAFKTQFHCVDCDCSTIAKVEPTFTGVTHCGTCWYTKLVDTFDVDDTTLLNHFSGIVKEQKETTSIVCTPQTTIILDATVLTAMKVTTVEEQLYLGKHKSCFPADKEATDIGCWATLVDTYAQFDVGSDKCSLPAARTIVAENGKDYLVLKYTVTSVPTLVPENPVQRYECAYKEFVCKIQVDQAAMTAPVAVGIKNVASTKVEAQSAYQLAFTLGGPATVEMDTVIAVTIKLTNVVTPANYQLTAGKCSAATLDLIKEYPILDCHGCPETNSYDTVGDITVTSNANNADVAFTFKAFRWTGKPEAEQKIYVHCNVNVCDTKASAASCPTPVTDCETKPVNCPGDGDGRMRFRRGLPSSEDRTVSFGPIIVTRSSQGSVLDHKAVHVTL